MDTDTAIDTLLQALATLRDGCTDEQWDRITSTGRFADLINACQDFEYCVENDL